MLQRIIHFSVENKLIVGLLVLGLIGWGAYNVTQLPIDAVPDITDNQVQVITVSPSLGAGDIERLITFPIEQGTRNIPGIVEQRSFSRFGLSVVTIVFEPRVDVYWARQQVSEKLAQVKVPEELGAPELAPVTTGLGEIFQYVVKPEPGYEGRITVAELRTIQDWIVRRQLLGTEGVADVSSFGGDLKQYEIAVDPRRLAGLGISISEVFDAVARNNSNTGGAYIEKGATLLYIRTEGLLSGMDDLRNVRIKDLSDGVPLLLRDVAEVRLGHATRYGAMTFNDEGEVAGAVVMMLKGANSSKVIKLVKERIAEIRKTLPEGVAIEPFLDRTKMVNNAISTVEKNLMEGALIVLFVLVLFLASARAGLVVASVIPLSMLFAVIMMNLFGVSGNLMSLGALDFGLIVDGAVIIVEAVLHRLHHDRRHSEVHAIGREEMDTTVGLAAGRMMRSAMFGQLIILIVYLPILSLQGVEGRMFKPMAQTVSFAVLGAFLLSLTYVPMASALFLSRRATDEPNRAERLLERLNHAYQRLLGRALHRPWQVVATAVALFGVCMVIYASLGGEFIPQLEEGDFAVETRMIPGSSLTSMIANGEKAAGILRRHFPEVEKVVFKIGSGEIPTDPMPIDAADMMVILKPKSQWTSASSFNELAEKMHAVLDRIPGVTFGFQYPVQMRFNELMTGARQDVVCKIFGEDLDTLARYAKRLGTLAGSVDGATDLYVETVSGLPQIVVQYDRAALARYGVDVADADRVVHMAFAGSTAGQIYEGERRFDLVIRSAAQGRTGLADVQRLLVPTPSGNTVPLSLLGKVDIVEGPNQIQREDAQRRIVVGFNVRGRDVESVVKELQDKVGRGMKLPPGYHVTYGGQFENLLKARARLLVVVPLALLLILLLLYFAFGSLPLGLLIFSAVPLSAIGGVLALWSRDMPFSISAGVGFIALFGVAVLNGIVLISEFETLGRSGVQDIMQRITKGTSTRLRPVLMTAAVASLGFLPMALSHGSGAEVQRPLATVVIGGLVTATLLTLLVLPALYLLYKRRGRAKNSGPTASAVTILLVLTLTPWSAHAQVDGPPIGLEQAVDSALKNNIGLREAALIADAENTRIGTAWDLPRTSGAYEFGQMNTDQNDTRLSVEQDIAFPTTYIRQAQVLQHTAEGRRSMLLLRQRQLRATVRIAYYRMLVLFDESELLRRSDSVFTAALQGQEARLAAGDANIVQRSSARMQQLLVRSRARQVANDLEQERTHFAQLLNTAVRYLPEQRPWPFPLDEVPGDELVQLHPLVLAAREREAGAEASWLQQRARSLPDLKFGWYQQTLNGSGSIGEPGRVYSAGDHFTAWKLGFSIPLFFHAQNARSRAAHIDHEAAKSNTLAVIQDVGTQLRQARQRYQAELDRVNGLGQGSAEEAERLRDAATTALANGEIGQFEWTLLTGQAVDLSIERLEAQFALSRAAIVLMTFQDR
ncbi:MAG: CusA/CzcA family heavy metal efflux RND transporter [Flavobacteriales bacterium]|nr:CusA/CzcA family heavy metal efflux RND transporter [Flavobacteriales bacterium]